MTKTFFKKVHWLVYFIERSRGAYDYTNPNLHAKA